MVIARSLDILWTVVHGSSGTEAFPIGVGKWSESGRADCAWSNHVPPVKTGLAYRISPDSHDGFTSSQVFHSYAQVLQPHNFHDISRHDLSNNIRLSISRLIPDLRVICHLRLLVLSTLR